jgi:uncharacterized protein
MDRKAEIKISVTANNMRALVTYIPAVGDGSPVTPDEFAGQLTSMGINTGIKNEVFDYICSSEKALNGVLIAEGINPEQGDNAKLETYITLNTHGKAKQKEDGSVDFRDLGEITSAKSGQRLYRRIPPTTGKSGIDVYGKEVPGIPGRDMKIVLGPGTALDKDDPNLVIASSEGEVLIKKGVMQISDIHTVHGDVDFSTGNLSFKGSIKIGGSVRAGFNIEAEGNIDIRGNVEDSIIICGGDVIVRGGFTGNGQGIIKAKQDVFVKFVENQRIEADRDIIIEAQAYHSILFAGRSVQTKSSKGAIVGGMTEAKISVEASTFGSIACPPTKIRIGTDFKFDEKLKSVESDLLSNIESLEKIEKSIIFLYRQKIDNNGVLPQDKYDLLQRLEQAKSTLPDKIAVLNEQKEQLLQQRIDLEKAFAIAEKAVYPKVQIYIGNQRLTVEDTLGPSQFRIIASEIVRLSK